MKTFHLSLILTLAAMSSDVVMVIASTIKEITPRCNTQISQLCLRCAYTTEGSSSPQFYCAPSHDANGISIPCPALVCCDIQTEEICYDTVTNNPISCARYDEGGCPCPEGQVKCDNSEHTKGHCISTDAPCCDLDEQACSDGTCKKYDEGPCPASSRRQPNESSSDNSSSSGKDFTVKTRLGHTRIGGTTKVEATFHYLGGKCIKDASTVLNSPYTNLSLQRCAKKCVNHGNECKGISFYNTLTKSTSDGVARMTGDCMLVKIVDDDDTVDCNEEDRGKVELYEKEEVLNVMIA